MYFSSRHHFSQALNREMYFNYYGDNGKPILVFPTSSGSCSEFADLGMVEAVSYFVEEGKIRFISLSSVDYDSWLSDKSPHEKASFHDLYDKYVISELIPLINFETGWYKPMGAVGCSMGAYHALNFTLKHPDVFDLTIALSGVYDVRYFTGDYGDDVSVYQNSPTDYIWNLEDEWFLERIRKADIICCTGQGVNEEQSIRDTRNLQDAFWKKNLPAWFDYWGNDVDHDWYWWKQQLSYYMNTLNMIGRI